MKHTRQNEPAYDADFGSLGAFHWSNVSLTGVLTLPRSGQVILTRPPLPQHTCVIFETGKSHVKGCEICSARTTPAIKIPEFVSLFTYQESIGQIGIDLFASYHIAVTFAHY